MFNALLWTWGVHLGWKVSVLPQKRRFILDWKVGVLSRKRVHFELKNKCFSTKKGVIFKLENKDGYYFFQWVREPLSSHGLTCKIGHVNPSSWYVNWISDNQWNHVILICEVCLPRPRNNYEDDRTLCFLDIYDSYFLSKSSSAVDNVQEAMWIYIWGKYITTHCDCRQTEFGACSKIILKRTPI